MREGETLLLRGLYRAADRWGDESAARWLGAAAKKMTDSTFVGGGAGWIRVHRIARRYDGAGMDDHARADVLAAYRCEVLAIVPRLARALVRRRGVPGSAAALIAAAKRTARKKCANAAHAALYLAGGRGGREVPLDWHISGAVHAGDMELTLASDALISMLGEGVPCLRTAPSSDPRQLASGRNGLRVGAEAEIATCIQRARAAISRRLALAAAGARGAGPIKTGAQAASSMLHHVERALRGQGFEPEIFEAIFTGKNGGFSDDFRKKMQRFRDFAGITRD